MDELFFEHRRVVWRSLRKGIFSERSERSCGLGSTAGPEEPYLWRALEVGGRLPEPVPPRLLPMLEANDFPERAWRDRVELLSHLATSAGAERFDLQLRELDRTIAAGPSSAPACERQHVFTLELKLSGPRGESAQLEESFPDAGALLQRTAGLSERVQLLAEDVRRKAEATPAPEGPLTVVIPPGSDAGVFFHEVCGHPMEGDVFGRRASFLAQRQGQQVGPAFLSVVDGVEPTGVGVRFGTDDEGRVPRTARLLDQGVVAEPLLDARTARRLERESNGHGRRVDFRHRAIPRMAHTAVLPHRGTLEELLGDVEDGLLVSFLTPRHVSLLTGEFCFQVVEARRIEQGRVGAFIGPALLRGDGLSALASVDAVGADAATFFGMKGCGKLDQGNLPVSFGLPTVRLRGLRVERAS